MPASPRPTVPPDDASHGPSSSRDGPAADDAPAPDVPVVHSGAVAGVAGASLLTVFAMLAEDSAYAPAVTDRVVLATLAGEQMVRFGHLTDPDHGHEDLIRLAQPHLELLDGIEARTVPGDWPERLMRTHISSSMLMDLVRVVVAAEPVQLRATVEANITGTGHGDYVVRSLTPLLTAQEPLAARLSLWGRRVSGEVLGVSQALLGGPEQLAGPLRALATPMAAGDVAHLLSERHSRRMARLGLTA